MKLQFAVNRVEWDGGYLDLPKPIKEAIRIGDYILVIHDYMAYPLKQPAPNLVAYTTTGERLWTAENLTKDSATDAYVGFFSEEPLWAFNFMCYRCKIDLQTGKLLERVFTK